MTNCYVHNLERGKLELHFEKSAYQALSDEQKREIKSNFLWSRSAGCWLSRAKEPNLWNARQVAEKLGLADAGRTGERLSFAEQMAAKRERAESRAERYEHHADKAREYGEHLQSGINAMHGDIAFFTQPILNTSAGRAFARKREKMFAAYEAGFREFNKSAYWRERAKIARKTSKGEELKDKGFVQRRIDECERDLRKLRKSYEAQKRTIERIEAGEEVQTWDGRPIDRKRAEENLDYWAERMEVTLDKLGYYQDEMDALGGVRFDRKSFKKGDLIRISRWREPVRYVRGGTKNFTYEFTVPHMKYADGSPMTGQAAFAEIEEVIAPGKEPVFPPQSKQEEQNKI